MCVTDDACHYSDPNASLRHKLGGTFPQGHNMYFPSPVRAKKKPPRLATHWRLHTSTAPPTPLFNVGRQRGAEAKATRRFCVGGFFVARPRRPMTTPTYAGALSCGCANSVVLAPTTLKWGVARGLFSHSPVARHAFILVSWPTTNKKYDNQVRQCWRASH